MSLCTAVHPSSRPGRAAAHAPPGGIRLVSALFVSAAAMALAAAVPTQAQKATQAPQAQAPGSVPPAPFGVWFDDTGRGAVEIRNCGDGLCGHIVWLQEAVNAKGQPITDGYNPDAGKRTRPVCGIQVIGDARLQNDGTWDNGWIYDPKTGKQYDVAIAVERPDRLKITGYKGVKFLSKSFAWTRAPGNIGRCDQITTQNFPRDAGGAPPATRAATMPRAK